MLRLILSLLFLLPVVATAEILVPVRTIRAKEIIGPADITQKQGQITGTLSDPDDVIGQEARVALYPGRAIRVSDVGPPAIVERNDLVGLFYVRGGLRISTEGRALGRGANGDFVRVMNLASRTTVMGQIRADGTIEVR